MSDLVGIPEDRFSHVTTQIIPELSQNTFLINVLKFMLKLFLCSMLVEKYRFLLKVKVSINCSISDGQENVLNRK